MTTTTLRPDSVRFGQVEATFHDKVLDRGVIAIVESCDPGIEELTPAQARELAAQLLAAAVAVEA